jgi:hypothetical protein
VLRRIFQSPVTSTTLLVLLLGYITLDMLGMRPFGLQVDYQKAGTWGDLVGGVAAATAVIIAVRSFATEAGRLEAERRRDRLTELTAIYAWLEPRLDSQTNTRLWLLRFENQVRVPIYHWSVEFAGVKKGALRSEELGPIRPGASELVVDDLVDLQPVDQPGFTFEFVDKEGTTWHRGENGDYWELGRDLP